MAPVMANSHDSCTAGTRNRPYELVVEQAIQAGR